MLKNHPKGLLAASLANTGERFGFYVMMAVLLLFLQSKFGLDPKEAGWIYSIFYASVYVLALVGGIIADRLRNYKGTIFAGLVVMFLGYCVLGIPGGTDVVKEGDSKTWLYITCGALALISFGNGLFKGNLQVIIGRMYDDPRYKDSRDAGFSLFYMFINVGAIFAPLIAVGIRNWFLQSNGVDYSAELPQLCHKVLDGSINADQLASFNALAEQASGKVVTDGVAFAQHYLELFNTGYHYTFWAAVGAMVLSLLIYIFNQKNLPADEKKVVATTDTQVSKEEIQMSASEIRQRLFALFAVFGVVIFFWMSFHQNGVSLTQFAKDYVNLSAFKLNLGFTELKGPELFQAVNPLFVVALTPVLMGLFGFLRARGLEPSTPKKIVIGMFVAALAFVVMALGSIGLQDKATIDAAGGLADVDKVTPWLLVGVYFILTLAELFISPMGLSFVSKVAPPHMMGMMQGLWLCSTAVGNSLLGIGLVLYESLPIYLVWVCFAGACGISMLTMLLMVKWLERVAK